MLGVYALPSRFLARAPVRAHRSPLQVPCHRGRACRRPSRCRLLSAEHMPCNGILLSNLCTQCISKDTQIPNTALVSLLAAHAGSGDLRSAEAIVTSRHDFD
jgi:hypothetical protein